MAEMIVLARRLGLEEAAPLKMEFLSSRGKDIEVDASQVGHLGTLCLQVLLAAARDWAGSGNAFRLKDPSEAMLSALAHFGLTQENFAGGNA